MTQSTPDTDNSKKKKDNPLLNIGLNIILPSVILTKFSGEQHLGQVYSLIIALLFPILYGLYDYIQRKKFNFFSALGLLSVVMTGGIGLFKLDRNWMVAKETGVPLIIGLVVIGAELRGRSLIKLFLEQILDFNLIENHFKTEKKYPLFEKQLKTSTYLLGGTFFISAFLNYVLAVIILVGEPGSVEFNESLGKMTALSFPVISLPMTVMVGVILFWLLSSIKKHTGLDLEAVVIKQ